MTQTKSKQVTKPVPVALLSPDPHNARKHDERSIQAIKASLERFGQVKPIVVQKEGMVVRCGNGTLLAAQELGWKSLKAIVSEMTEAEIVAYAIADNRTAELAEWDQEELANLIGVMSEDEITSLGFAEKDVEELAGVFAVEPMSLDEVDKVPGEDRSPIQQMTFTLHEDQVADVEAAIKRALEGGAGTSEGNENSRGNALVAICGEWLANG